MVHQLRLEYAHVLHVPAEPGAWLGRGAGGATLDQHRAEPFLELPDTLGDRRGCHIQRSGGPLEATRLNDERDGSRCGIVNHDQFL